MSGPRLTPEQAKRLDADAVNTIAALPNIVEFFHGEEMPFSRCDSGNTHAWRCRVLDLLADVKALRERAEMAQWRPIESAPKDGTLVLGHNPTWVAPFVVRWGKHNHTPIRGWVRYSDTAVGEGDIEVEPCNPTVWQYFHAPPPEGGGA